jgi:hypothetical protein
MSFLTDNFVWTMVIGGVILVALVGLLLFLRNQRPD